MTDYTKYCVIDLETSIKNRGEDAVGNMKASPFHPDNKIVYTGFKYPSVRTLAVIEGAPAIGFPNVDVFVGQNFKFDLLYLFKQTSIQQLIYTHNIKLWDVGIVEYLLTGQQAKFISLDDLARKYGGTVKDDRIKEYWNNNIDTEDIPKEEIIPYVEQDVLNTMLVYEKQLKKVEARGMLPLVEVQMDALLATTEMEYAGMRYDYNIAYELHKEVQEEFDLLDASIRKSMEDLGIVNPNPASNDHKSFLLFGGVQIYVEKEKMLDDAGEVVLFKSGPNMGKERYKNVTKQKIIGQSYVPNPKSETAKAGIYSTNAEVLASMAGYSKDAENLLKHRALQKDISTYYLGIGKLWWPTDGCIHGNLNHNATNTGRLSSSNPNMQNLAGDND